MAPQVVDSGRNQARMIFELCDKDVDRLVTKEEFIDTCNNFEQILPYFGVDKGCQKAVGIDNVARIVFEFETRLNFTNFLEGVLKSRRTYRSEPPPLLPLEEVLKMAWQVIDTNRDGQVSINEVNKIWKARKELATVLGIEGKKSDTKVKPKGVNFQQFKDHVKKKGLLDHLGEPASL